MNKKVAVLVGSLRKDSVNRKVAQYLISLASPAMTLEFVEIGDLILYNPDLDDEHKAPETWMKFRDQIRGYDGVLFVTPEYNRSIPASLKNAIDVGSRPYGQSVWNNKPAAIISISPGAMGGFGANQHLRQSLGCLNMPLMLYPEAYVGQAGALFNEQEEITREDSQKFFINYMELFARWLELHALK